MTPLQAVAVFAGGPALIVLLVFLPFYGRRWGRRLVRLVRRRPSVSADVKTDDSAERDAGTGTD